MTLLFFFYSFLGILSLVCSVQQGATTDITNTHAACRVTTCPPLLLPLACASEGCGSLWYVHLFVVLRDVLIYFLFIRAFFLRHMLAFPFCPSVHDTRLPPLPFVATRLSSPSPFALCCDVTIVAFPLRPSLRRDRRHLDPTCDIWP